MSQLWGAEAVPVAACMRLGRICAVHEAVSRLLTVCPARTHGSAHSLKGTVSPVGMGGRLPLMLSTTPRARSHDTPEPR